MNKQYLLILKVIASLILYTSLSSCVTHSNLMLLNEGERTSDQGLPIQNFSLPIIQPNDNLFIDLNGENEAALEPYVRARSNTQQFNNLGNQNANLLGYLVNSKGEIEYPGLGTIQIGGLDIEEAQDYMEQQLSVYISNFTISIRLLNFRITIAGEVGGGGMIQVMNDRITILEALGQAGGLTPYSDLSNIELHREINGQRTYHVLNLHDKNIFESPYFYLKQNDYIYVRPLSQKTATVANQSRNILPWLGLAASAINLYLLFTRL